MDDLAKQSADLAVKGELAIRRADRALWRSRSASSRRLDQMFTTTSG